MSFLWPEFLVLLSIIPALAALYLWMLRRRRRYAVHYSSLSLVRAALPRWSRLRRHLPFVLFLIALASLVLAFGRPVATVQVPSGRNTVILAMDVSRSMCSTDIQPNRLEAAKDAARLFIQRQIASSQIGIVAFAGFAELVQAPTADQEMLEDAVAGLTTGRRTAIGSAILKALDSIAEINAKVAPSSGNAVTGEQPTPPPPGSYLPDVIVLLTDGASNAGVFPLDAAQQATDRGIRVYTIGFGTEFGGDMNCGDQFFGGFGGGGGFGRDSFGGGGFRRGIDEETLKAISAQTGGEYYAASSAGELQKVFRDIPTTVTTRTETMEISVAFTAVGALFAALAVLLSLLWHPLP